MQSLIRFNVTQNGFSMFLATGHFHFITIS